MRAAESSVCLRASSWQSQRVTRRSLIISSGAWGPAETVFQPLPPHNGQASGRASRDEVWGEEVLIADALLIETLLTEFQFTHTLSRSQRFIRLCTADRGSRKSSTGGACVHPVKRPLGLWMGEENRGEPRSRPRVATKSGASGPV